MKRGTINLVREVVPSNFSQTFPTESPQLGPNLVSNGGFEIGPAPVTGWVPVRAGSKALQD